MGRRGLLPIGGYEWFDGLLAAVFVRFFEDIAIPQVKEWRHVVRARRQPEGAASVVMVLV